VSSDAASQLVKLLQGLEEKGTTTDAHLEKVIGFIDRYGEFFNVAQCTAVREQVVQTFKLTEKQLKAMFESGAKTNEKCEVEDDFTHLLPKSPHMLTDYVKHTSKTEWPPPYRAFSFLTVLGALLGRQISLDRNTYRVWPNMVSLLVGPTGEGRKTTCAEFAMKMARAADEDRFYQVGEKVTSEAIHTALAERVPATGILYAPELSTVINKKDYTRTLINDLTRLWDCPDILPVRTIARGPEELKEVGLSFLACSNEEWLLKSIPEDAHKGGFFARMLQVYHPGVTDLYSEPPPLDKIRHDELLAGLVETRRCRNAELTRGAKVWFDKRYKEIRRSHYVDPRMAAFNARRHDHILRLGLLLGICRERTETVYVDEFDLQTADNLIGWIVKWLPKIYMLTGLTEVGEDTRRILYILLANGGRITRKRLLGELYGRMTVGQVDDRLKTLTQAGFVQYVGASIFGDHAVYYKLIKHPDEN
jgi:hypothetical protein